MSLHLSWAKCCPDLDWCRAHRLGREWSSRLRQRQLSHIMSTFSSVTLCAPVVQNVIISKLHVGVRVPPEDYFASGWQTLFELIPPISPQFPIVRDVLELHKCFYLWTEIPTSRWGLIASKMNIWRVSKELVYFADYFFGKLINWILGDIELFIVALSSWTSYSNVFSLPFWASTPWTNVSRSVDLGH